MLTRIDRIQMAVYDRKAVSRRWETLLGAEPAGEDEVVALGARRSRHRLGDGFVEFLEPSSGGPVADAVSRRGPHIFAAGTATPDLDGLRARLRRFGVEPPYEAGQLHVPAASTGGHGLHIVVSPEETRPRVGAIQGFYEVTNLVHDVAAAVGRFVELFGLDTGSFVPIESAQYGYDGTLTLFRSGRLDRIEMITPRDAEKTMGRFFRRFGESLYMAFAECDELEAVERRAIAAEAGHTVVPPNRTRAGRPADTVFLHPDALGGMMLGLSRPSVAWSWSGDPARVEPAT